MSPEFSATASATSSLGQAEGAAASLEWGDGGRRSISRMDSTLRRRLERTSTRKEFLKRF